MIKPQKYQNEIIAQGTRIRERINGGTLYGYPIDMSDPDELIMAAYQLGRYDANPARSNFRRLATMTQEPTIDGD